MYQFVFNSVSSECVHVQGTATGDAGTTGLDGSLFLFSDSAGGSNSAIALAELLVFGELTAGQTTSIRNTLKSKYAL